MTPRPHPRLGGSSFHSELQSCPWPVLQAYWMQRGCACRCQGKKWVQDRSFLPAGSVASPTHCACSHFESCPVSTLLVRFRYCIPVSLLISS